MELNEEGKEEEGWVGVGREATWTTGFLEAAAGLDRFRRAHVVCETFVSARRYI